MIVVWEWINGLARCDGEGGMRRVLPILLWFMDFSRGHPVRLSSFFAYPSSFIVAHMACAGWMFLFFTRRDSYL